MPSSRPQVLLIGQGITTLDALEGLVERFDVVGLIRAAPADGTSERARRLGVPVFADTTLAAVTEAVARLRPDCVVVSSYDRILRASLLEACPFVNVHYAPLPRYRGRATVNWAIINGEPSTAMTVHCLVPGLDAGGILCQEEVPISDTSTVVSLYDELNRLERQHLADAVLRRLAGDEGTPQDESAATYACTRLPEDGEIEWSSSTAGIDRLVRALGGPFPCAFTYLGAERIELVSACPGPEQRRYEGRIPGRVVAVHRDSGDVDVLTGDGVLRVSQVRVGGEAVPAWDVIRSVRATLGRCSAHSVSPPAGRTSKRLPKLS